MVDINILDILNIAKKAGEEILEVYDGDNENFGIEIKSDNSPLTLADKKSNDVIVNSLKKLYSDIPILSEEEKALDYDERKNWDLFWLVDPLDGTKEFIKRNGEFTVNIALIENQKSVMGVIYVPVEDVFYFGVMGEGSYKLVGKYLEAINTREELLENSSKLPILQKRPFRIVGSRSHMSEETEEYINSFKEKYPDLEIISKGSSLKMCMVAEGVADVYPRFAPTMEWDTGAGHAVAKFAGCKVIDYQTKEELLYNKENLLNNWFVIKR